MNTRHILNICLLSICLTFLSACEATFQSLAEGAGAARATYVEMGSIPESEIISVFKVFAAREKLLCYTVQGKDSINLILRCESRLNAGLTILEILRESNRIKFFAFPHPAAIDRNRDAALKTLAIFSDNLTEYLKGKFSGAVS